METVLVNTGFVLLFFLALFVAYLVWRLVVIAVRLIPGGIFFASLLAALVRYENFIRSWGVSEWIFRSIVVISAIFLTTVFVIEVLGFGYERFQALKQEGRDALLGF